tara:strand:+ start:2432 stop:2869 length:438 start_codon:yes stop_codon:yes gene_type:complete
MRLITWRPISRTNTIFNEIDNWFNSVSSNLPYGFNENSIWEPKFEVLNIDNAYRIRAEIPGMVKKDVNIEVVDNQLTISGERKIDHKDLDNNYSEFSYGKFSRSFNLPDDVLENKIKASMKDGVLALEIPRMEQLKSEVKKIQIK